MPYIQDQFGSDQIVSILVRSTSDVTTAPYDYHHRQIIRICSIASSSVSILCGIIAFYCLGMIHPKRRIFRYDLIFLLIVYDFIKGLALLIYPVVSETTHESILTSRPFKNALGWFTSFSIEGADFIILCFAVHIALLIFFPSLKNRLKETHFTTSSPQEGGLYPFRMYIYLLSILFPTIVSTAAFAPGQGYSSGVNWSYLTELRGAWYFAWIFRYCIVVTILTIYVGVYVHVMRQHKVVSSKMKLEKPESGRLMSELLSDSFWYKLGKMVLMLVFPDVQISAKLHGRELNSEADLENLRHLQDGGAVVGVQTEDYQNPREGSGSTTTTTVQYPASGSTSNDIGSDAESTNEEHIKKLQREIGLDIQRMLHREAMDRFQMRRVQIMKQMKVIFVYPLAYIVLWMFPFIHQCYILRDGGNSWNCYWAYTAAAFFQAFNCTVDTLVFLGREKPWTITAAKVDPYQRYSYSRWRRAVSFLPGYELGGVPASSSAPMSKSAGSGSSDGAGTIDPEKGVTEAAQQRSSSLTGIEPRSENITSQAGFNAGYGNFNLNDENVSDFVKVDTNGRPYAPQSRNGSSVDPNDSDLSLRDFLNSTLPKGDMAGGTEEQPTVSSPQGSPQKEKKRSQEQRRGSKFSWRTFSWKSSSGSSRKQSVASSIDPDTKLPELE